MAIDNNFDIFCLCYSILPHPLFSNSFATCLFNYFFWQLNYLIDIDYTNNKNTDANVLLLKICKTGILNYILPQLLKEWQYNKALFPILHFSQKIVMEVGIQIYTVISMLKYGEQFLLDIAFWDPHLSNLWLSLIEIRQIEKAFSLFNWVAGLVKEMENWYFTTNSSIIIIKTNHVDKYSPFELKIPLPNQD